MKEIVKEITQTVSTFIANDGTEFNTEQACLAHEREIADGVRLVKMERIFGEKIVDFVADWCLGYGQWYKAKIKTEEDLVDFLAIVKEYDAWDMRTGSNFQDKRFIDEVMSVIKNDETFEMLIWWNSDGGYVTRVFPVYNHENSYDYALKRINNLRIIADELERYIKYEPIEEEEK